MPATMTRPAARKANTGSTRPVPELLLELAYRPHATKVVRRPALGETLPKKG